MSSSSSTIITQTTTPLLSATNPSHQSGLLSSLYDKPNDTNKKTEFEIYLNSDLQLGDEEDLLQFWIQQRENYPQLFELAKKDFNYTGIEHVCRTTLFSFRCDSY